jgi:hypothetical protein
MTATLAAAGEGRSAKWAWWRTTEAPARVPPAKKGSAAPERAAPERAAPKRAAPKVSPPAVSLVWPEEPPEPVASTPPPPDSRDRAIEQILLELQKLGQRVDDLSRRQEQWDQRRAEPPPTPPAPPMTPTAPPPPPRPPAASAASPASREEWPGWLQVGVELRGRAERFTGIGFQSGNDDLYYLHRARLNAAVQVRPWLRLVTQVQDAQVLAYAVRPAPASVADTLDLREGYVELRPGGPWQLRAGRQELAFGEQRQVGHGNWGNTARSFDAVRLSYTSQRVRFDWFASSVVVPVNGRFDRRQDGNNLHGFYASFDHRAHKGVIEPYVLWKTTPLAAAEAGRFGDLDVYTYGLRAVGQLRPRWDYGVEVALQRGHVAADRLAAWAGHWALGYRLGEDTRAPRLVLEYNFASGDKNPTDGRRGTYHQLFPTNHDKYGTVDRIGWRNIHDAMAGLEWKPYRKWKLNLDFHSFWLASRRDAFYSEAGAVLFRNPAVAGSHVGYEADLQALYQYSKQLQWGLGYGYLFSGEYLRQASSGASGSAPYIMWNYRF